MNKHVALRTFVTVSLMALALPAMSEKKPPNPPLKATVVASGPIGVLAKYDMTEQELKASPLFFDNLDRNHDGYLSRSEVPKSTLHELYMHFNDYATNGQRLDRARYELYVDWHIGQGSCTGFTSCGPVNPYAVAKGP